MDAVAFALVSAALFGGMTVAIRLGLARSGDARLAALTMTLTALAVSLAIALVVPQHGAVSLSAIWPFLVAGVLSPGLGNFCFTRAIAEAGPSRASVVVGMAPLFAVAIALVVLHEPLRTPLVVGACVIVLGGVALASERIRPADFRVVGLVLAFAAAVLFSARDNLVRRLADSTDVAPLAAASATLLGATVVLALLLLATGEPLRARRLIPSARAFAPAGLLFAVSYATLFEAYFRGRVTVVSPLVATESLWGVGLSALLVGRSELVGRRIVAGAVLIVAGGALIGAARA